MTNQQSFQSCCVCGSTSVQLGLGSISAQHSSEQLMPGALWLKDLREIPTTNWRPLLPSKRLIGCIANDLPRLFDIIGPPHHAAFFSSSSDACAHDARGCANCSSNEASPGAQYIKPDTIHTCVKQQGALLPSCWSATSDERVCSGHLAIACIELS